MVVADQGGLVDVDGVGDGFAETVAGERHDDGRSRMTMDADEDLDGSAGYLKRELTSKLRRAAEIQYNRIIEENCPLRIAASAPYFSSTADIILFLFDEHACQHCLQHTISHPFPIQSSESGINLSSCRRDPHA